jgi:putative transposase
MARLSRLVVAGHPHLVMQRGHNRQPVFLNAEDQRLYLEALREAARVHAVSIHAYGLRASQALLLATPTTADGLSKMMQALGRRYVGSFNRRHGRVGTLWEGRFRATVIESAAWFQKCLVFVESPSNDMEPGLIASRSSAPHHLGKLNDPLIWEHADFWILGNTPFEREAAYKLLLEEGIDRDAHSAIAQAVEQGWPLGDQQFVTRLGQHITRRLAPLKRGRRKQASPVEQGADEPVPK